MALLDIGGCSLGSPSEVLTCQDLEDNANQLPSRPTSIFCPPIPTPLAETALHWGLDDDRRLIQKDPWPDTPAPWNTEPSPNRTAHGRAEPILPPVDADDELPVPSSAGLEAFPTMRYSEGASRPWTFPRKSDERPGAAVGRPPSRGARLARSLTSAFRKRSGPAHAALDSPVFAPNSTAHNHGLTNHISGDLRSSTSDPERFEVQVDDMGAQNRIVGTSSTVPHRYLFWKSRSRLNTQDQIHPGQPRRVIHVLWKGRKTSHDVGRPENYVERISRLR